MFAWPDRTAISVTGPDWRSFLQGLLTQDVETMKAGDARFGALLTPQGRILWDMFIVAGEEGCWLDVPRFERDAIIARLKVYRLRAKVEISPMLEADGRPETPVSTLFSVPTTPEGKLLFSSRGEDQPSTPPEVTPLGARCDGMRVWVRDPRLPELGWRGYGVGRPTEANLMFASTYDQFRRSLGVPDFDDWGSDKTYPIEANFDLLNGIDFKKGCFVGQETTSRMKRRGQIKNRMLPITFEGPEPDHGAEVLAGKLRAGAVLSGHKGRAIALLRLDRALGAELTVDGRPARAEVPDWMAEAIGEAA